MVSKKRTTAIVVLVSLWITGSSFGQFDALKRLTQPKSAVAAKTIAHFKIKGVLTETPARIPPLFGSEPPLSLKSLLARLKAARVDPNVVAVVLDVQEAALGLAQLQEVHAALRQFDAVDKDVYIHADSLNTRSYAVATGGSHISIVPTGDLWLLGLYGEAPYLRGTLDKLGIVPDFEHCGDFKTGPEVFTRSGPSEEAKRMTDWMLDDLYEHLVSLIAESRGMTPEKIRDLIDDAPYSAEEALKAGLIDSVKHRQDFISDLESRYGRSVKITVNYGHDDDLALPQDPFAFFSFLMQLMNPSKKVYTEPSVAIVYVEGTIQPGKGESSPFGAAQGAFSTSIRKALDEAAQDQSVKAVVLRVDSPGGSALASEIILDATRRVAAKKPLIVSMGNVAASGGYYVSCAAETVFADPTTITASIGVWGGKLVTTGAWDKIGISWHANQRGKMAALFSTSGTFTDQERAKIVKYMNTVYDTFRKHVKDARGDHLTKPLDEITGGRVFTGAQALERGLIDKLGGLEDAIKYAAQKARLGEYDIRVIPEPPTIFDLLLSGTRDEEYTSAAGRALCISGSPIFKAMIPALEDVDPLRVRAILHAVTRLEIIRREGVVMMMPSDLVIR